MRGGKERNEVEDAKWSGETRGKWRQTQVEERWRGREDVRGEREKKKRAK